jgi:hypothetical protein
MCDEQIEAVEEPVMFKVNVVLRRRETEVSKPE